jgi:hypothetical protein
MSFFFEVLIGGLLSGVMYSLVALGFVLIYKASGVFNFAQGAMVFFAALTFVGFHDELHISFWLSFVLTLATMVVLGLLTERIVLRPLVNQPQITLFMATIGLTFVIEGLAQLFWGSQPHNLELGIQDEPLAWITDSTGMNVSKFDLAAAGIAAALVTSLALFFSRTRIGRALRAVPTTTRPRSPWAFRCSRSGGSSGRWPASWRWWRDCCGCAQRRAILADVSRAEGAAGADPRRIRVGAGRDRRRADRRRFRKARRGLSRTVRRRRHRGLVPVRAGVAVSASRPEGLFGEKHIDRV